MRTIPQKPIVTENVLAPRDITIIKNKGFFNQIRVVVGVTIHNNKNTIRRCINSIVEQTGIVSELGLVILDDSSSDDWEPEICDLLLLIPHIQLSAMCGTPAHARNAILDFIDRELPYVEWVARLDADDSFSSEDSLSSMIKEGMINNSEFILGSNNLVDKNGNKTGTPNVATTDLLDRSYLHRLVMRMSEGIAEHELPSCNLVLKTKTGHRYPNKKSAEDHFLVLQLLYFNSKRCSIVSYPIMVNYCFEGNETLLNRKENIYGDVRKKLYKQISLWQDITKSRNELLGFGQEGVIVRDGLYVKKIFYSDIKISVEKKLWLETTFNGLSESFPGPIKITLEKEICLSYPYFASSEWSSCLNVDSIKEFLLECLRLNVVPENIKRSNFRVLNSGKLIFVDIGCQIIPFSISHFMDCSARLYGIAVLNYSDDELRRRNAPLRQENIYKNIPGFEDFYRSLLENYGSDVYRDRIKGLRYDVKIKSCENVTLLIKCCSMDYPYLIEQVKHIVSSLQVPTSFSQRILLVDSFNGSLLRQHSEPNLDLVVKQAEQLKNEGWIDEIWVSPQVKEITTLKYMDWFNVECTSTHTIIGAPLFPQLWAFDKIQTKYVLQCDIDILICRRDSNHDYLRDMFDAAEKDDVLGVAFNIPFDENTPFNIYNAPMGEYVPEVRCGLLDLERIRALKPFPNRVENNKMVLTWHRSLLQFQRENGYRTLRGGDSRTFYLHPLNELKYDLDELSRIRDLVEQDRLPTSQFGHWDVIGPPAKWKYPQREEKIVILVKGRNIEESKVARCIGSLSTQDNQSFGIIVIDDFSDLTNPTMLPHLLGAFKNRVTLIRRPRHFGRIPNFITGISEVCINPDTMVVILDQDDYLMNREVVRKLEVVVDEGYDLIIGGCFRKDKPLKTYQPNFDKPRTNWGGNVWTHMRCFKKKIFDAIPLEHFKINGNWIEECTDYATMIPMVELSEKPYYISEYLYCHEPHSVTTEVDRVRKDAIILEILARKCLSKS